jgi:hypothetical protein
MKTSSSLKKNLVWLVLSFFPMTALAQGPTDIQLPPPQKGPEIDPGLSSRQTPDADTLQPALGGFWN